jgi:predicted Zn-dependent protease
MILSGTGNGRMLITVPPNISRSLTVYERHMRNNQATAIKIIALVACLLIAGCVTIYNPATERKETFFIDTNSEVSIGRDMTKQIEQKYKVSADASLKQRVERIGKRIAAASDRQDLQYQFNVIQDKELNAFALPGGFIYVNSGLMNAATDDELACVLAHEVGHVAARHSVKKLQTTLGYQLVLGLALGATGQQAMGSAMDVVYGLINLGYSRQDEQLSDKLSVKYAKKAGFNPYGMITFFEKLKKDSQTQGGHYKPVFLSSHPGTDERIQNVYNEISKLGSDPK